MDKGKITAAFATLLLTTAIIASLPPQATATPTMITTVTPDSGPVGTTVGVIGEIDTLNGSYKIFFDEEEVKNGIAVDGAVNDTFVVPHRPGGNYTVKLHDVTGNTNDITTFTVETAYYIKAVVPTPPEQLQEGESTEIWVNVTGGAENTCYWANITVTDPSGAVCYNDTLQLTNTTNTGYGEGSRTCPTHFSSGAHTNYTGIYNIAFNGTLKTGSFTVGLTNATEYYRFQVVNIRATGYQPSESVWVNITFAGEDVISISKNASAGGVIDANWEIPGNASMGLYTVTVTNSTTLGTVKSIPDAQNFTIVEIPFQMQTKKLDGEVLTDVEVHVYNATNELIDSNVTDEEGLASFSVEGGNYSFKAYWEIEPTKYVLVGALFNQSIKEEPKEPLTLWCWIAHLRIAVSPPFPFIDVTLTYYEITSSFETNNTGIIETYYMPTNVSYTVEARRYGFLFFNKTIERLNATIGTGWVNMTITLPTCTMSVNVVDWEEKAIPNVRVSLAEWSSLVPVDLGTTNNEGNVILNATLGRYEVNVYNYSALLEREVVLNETTIDLFENRLLTVHCKIFNVILYVKALDYFGQPISKALVKVERKFGQEWVEMDSLPTESDGVARFVPLRGLVGGDCRVSVYVAGKLCGIKNLYLEGSKQVLFKIDKYTMIVGHLVETSHLIAYISIGLLVVVFVLAMTYRRLLSRFVKKKEQNL